MNKAVTEAKRSVTEVTSDRITEQYIRSARITYEKIEGIPMGNPYRETLMEHLQDQAGCIAHRSGINLSDAYKLIEGEDNE